jgi:hypothetical protein
VAIRNSLFKRCKLLGACDKLCSPARHTLRQGFIELLRAHEPERAGPKITHRASDSTDIARITRLD